MGPGRSSAWDSRHVISAWWVKPENIRKETPEGDPLAHGVVWTVGERNFLPPAPLIMGFGFMFQLGDEAGRDAHLGDRTIRGGGGRGASCAFVLTHELERRLVSNS